MTPEEEEVYIKMAQEHPDMRCCQVPFEILEAASFSGEEPTAFLKAFLSAGYQQWLLQCWGRRAYLDRERIDRAVNVLWLRACDLYTSYVLHLPHPAWEQLFFSDEGLYD